MLCRKYKMYNCNLVLQIRIDEAKDGVQPMNWDDLRFFAEVAHRGSLSAAARHLGVNQSTVFRRMKGFEESLGVRVFDRLPSGYVLTAAGERMRDTALRIEGEIAGIDREVLGQDARLEGSLRVTTAGIVAVRLLAPHLAAFARDYPGIDLEIVASDEFRNLSKREADIAIRGTNRPPDALIGRKLCAITGAIYGSVQYLAEQGEDALEAHNWIALEDERGSIDAAKWLKSQYPKAHIALRSNDINLVIEAVRQNMGLATLPCFLAEGDPVLCRLGPPLPELATDMWLLTHEDLRHTVRVRAFMDFMTNAIAGQRDLLEFGEGGEL